MSPAKPRVLCIVGPTCSGKTAFAVEVARRIPAEIISADSRQVFRQLTIGTAKPPIEILREFPHHFIDIVDPDQPYSAGQFGHDAARTIDEIAARGRHPIVVGGSGLYLRALIDGMHHAPGHDPAIRAMLEQRMAVEGVDALFDELRNCDPLSAERIAMKHKRRIIRALEVFRATGIPLSQWQDQKTEPAFVAEQIGLRWERRELYARIDARVDAMMDMGLLDEVRGLLARGFTDALQSLNTPGYKELFAHLRGEISLDRAVELIKQHSRNYAKRQVTWFSADERVRWIDVAVDSSFEAVADSVIRGRGAGAGG